MSVAVALAEKIDTLTGFWAIDEKPTGSKDPFALRRAALGVIRLVLENDLSSLRQLLTLWHMDHLTESSRTMDRQRLMNSLPIWLSWRARLQDALTSCESRLKGDLIADLLSFFHDRLKVYLKDQGIRHDIIDACIAMPGNDDLTLLVKRAEPCPRRWRPMTVKT